MTDDARAQTLSAAARHCENAESAADEGRWDAVQSEVRAMQLLLEELLTAAGLNDLPDAAPSHLESICARVKRLRTRAVAGREEIAGSLTSMRRGRTAAATYRRHG